MTYDPERRANGLESDLIETIKERDALKARVEELEKAIMDVTRFVRDTLPSSEHGQRITFEGCGYILFNPEDWENFEQLLEPWAREALKK